MERIIIKLNQEVADNTNYITCEEGEFSENDFILCKNKYELTHNTVMFLANQIIKSNESSS